MNKQEQNKNKRERPLKLVIFQHFQPYITNSLFMSVPVQYKTAQLGLWPSAQMQGDLMNHEVFNLK